MLLLFDAPIFSYKFSEIFPTPLCCAHGCAAQLRHHGSGLRPTSHPKGAKFQYRVFTPHWIYTQLRTRLRASHTPKGFARGMPKPPKTPKKGAKFHGGANTPPRIYTSPRALFNHPIDNAIHLCYTIRVK